MKIRLPNEVLSQKMAPLLMRLADLTDQVIEVTADGVVLRDTSRAPIRHKRIKLLERMVADSEAA